ncbi:hypothetical protein NCY64_18630, partial [Phocaeicola vulgatus]|nr:hypothetical protein [Phocaeicola vulgatus]MCM1737804.1 hypothetical protein [Phocaeicola vulgatus]MCM1766398.1 hypothetical protein [Phocaeicola vulgatus]MCM1782295.1 hypothetical protein [Phocaeicola vulgatus]MCM1907614.1 hypothetical protein [Phocaeicola vulgatus]
MDFPDQFSKIFLAYQPFPSAPTRKFEAFMPSCPHCKHNKLTINHLYANGKSGSPDKSGGKFFNSIENLHLCTMNNQGLLALAQLILPSEILSN